jgi:hypothetical protein
LELFPGEIHGWTYIGLDLDGCLSQQRPGL